MYAARGNLLDALKPHGAGPRAYAIIVDEAGYLAGQHIKDKDERKQVYVTFRAFLDILMNEFCDTPDYLVYSVTLLGVDSLRGLLHDINRPADQQHAVEQRQARTSDVSSSAMHVEASGDSDLSRNWTPAPISPFSEHHLFELDSFSVTQIADLLRQYTDQQREVVGHMSPLDVEALARIIHERTGGSPGLVGPAALSVISNTAALLTSSHTWERLRVLLRDLLLHNRCVAKRSESRSVVKVLLTDGIARVVSSIDAAIELEVRSPLQQDVMLMEARFTLHACPSPPDLTKLDMQWVLREAFRRVDIRNIKAATAGAKSSPFSEHVWHGELLPLIKAIINKAYPTLVYRTVTEVRALSSARHHRKRIDLVMTHHQRLPAHGVETVICGSQADVEERYTRALEIYQPFYSAHTSDGVPLPSTIQVVNICAENYRGDGYKWQPAHEAEHVKMVHVMLCNDGRNALITWSNESEETLTVQSAAHGELQYYAPPEL
ncbi:g10661 [Coccomyxa elongata]